MLKKHKIYILYTGMFCKVGVTSRNIESRLKEIQTNCPFPIYAYRTFGNLSKGNAYFIESKLKEQLQQHLIFGEWYKQFENIRRSISYLIEKHTSEEFETHVYHTGNKRFEDLSIKKLNEIKEHRSKNDLTSLSNLYHHLIFNKNYNETRFFFYSKEDVVKQAEIAIRNTISYYNKNNIEVTPETEKKLVSAKTNKTYNIEKIHKPSAKNSKKRMNAVKNRYPFLFEDKE